MSASGFRHVYGPVPSRRLGRSLGIDLVPFKTCSENCVYCQLGRTTHLTLDRREYVPLEEVEEELASHLASGSPFEFIGLAGSGEPTLHSRIGDLIRRIKLLTDVPVAVLTNGSLLWMPEVREALMGADLVLPSLDAGSDRRFQEVNRPHPGISFPRMVDGLEAFTHYFPGEVWLEVLLLADVWEQPEEIEHLADLLRRIAPDRIQLNTVTRPPAESWARPLSVEHLESIRSRLPGVVEIIASVEAHPEVERAADAPGTAMEGKILALISRRPCSPNDVALGLGIHANEAVKHLDRLVATGRAATVVSPGGGGCTPRVSTPHVSTPGVETLGVSPESAKDGASFPEVTTGTLFYVGCPKAPKETTK